MQVNWKAVAAAIIVVGAVVGPATAAAANGTNLFDADSGAAEATLETQSVSSGGGRAADGSHWVWGAGGIGGKTFSHYFRERSCHGATAVGKRTHRVTRVPGGKWAKAAVPSAASGNKAYYHTC